jgi:hypothetical protein
MRILGWMLVAGGAMAQWIHYPTAGVPRLADGRLNAAAPAPRTADGKPDFSGLWWIGGLARPCPALLGGPGDCAEKGLGLQGQAGADLAAQAANIAAGLEGGLPYRPETAALMRERSATPGRDDPHVRCLPSNPPRHYTLPHLQKFVQTPGLLLMLNEYNASYRQIFLDGRPLPEDPNPSWNGYSTARWEGDTLVVETIGFRDDLWLDMVGNPLSSAAKLTERITRPEFGTMRIEFTVDDPKHYTRPWTVHLEQFLVADTELMDEFCLEGERSAEHMRAQ